MKIFQKIEELFDSMGIRRQQQKHPFNARNSFIVALFAQFSATAFIYFLFKASTFSEFANSFYITATATFNIFTFPWNIFHTKQLFNLIDQLENIIEKREFLFELRNCICNFLNIQNFNVVWTSTWFKLIKIQIDWEVYLFIILYFYFLNFERIGLKNSAPRSIYVAANEAINKGTTIFYLILFHVSVPGGLIPYIFLTLFLYYKTGLGTDAYTLPFLTA